MATWQRGTIVANEWPEGFSLLASIASGNTLLRVRFRWGFAGDTSILAGLTDTIGNVVGFGIVTTVGNGTETPPFPRTTPNDQAPPTQRWLYLEARQPVVSALSNGGNLVAWRDSGPQEATQTKGQVAATGMPAGDTLNVWASWESSGPWDNTGAAYLYVSWSVLSSVTT